jgi:hypothetical protein
MQIDIDTDQRFENTLIRPWTNSGAVPAALT